MEYKGLKLLGKTFFLKTVCSEELSKKGKYMNMQYVHLKNIQGNIHRGMNFPRKNTLMLDKIHQVTEGREYIIV